jgi:hypothetical protein
MPAGLAAMDRTRRYRLTEARASAVLALLDANAALVAADGQTELAFEMDRALSARRAPRVSLRFGVGQDFGELHLVDADGGTSVAHIYAAGPIERILQAIGYREVSRAVVVARRYRFHDAEVRIAHIRQVGWVCEVRTERAEDLTRVVAALGHAGIADAASAGTPSAPRRWSEVEQRTSDRRAAERRASRFQFLGNDRRTMLDRRVGDRRLTVPT